MADVPDPVPTDGWANVRRLGRFGPPDSTQTAESDSDALQLNPGYVRDVVALVLIVVSMASITTGVTALLGWAWGAIVFGMMCAVIGVLLGITSSGPDSKDDAE